MAVVLLSACGARQDGPTAPALGVAEVEFESFKLLGAARADGFAGPALRLDETLSAVAREHSEAMRDLGFFGHTDLSGEGLRDRLWKAGVEFSSAAENLVQVSHRTDPAALAHSELMTSPSHRANTLEGDFREVGVGVARIGDQYWVTQIFLAAP